MTPTSIVFFSLVTVAAVACGGRPDDEFTHGTTGGTTYSASAAEAGAAGAGEESSMSSGAGGEPSAAGGAPSTSAGAPSATGGAAPTRQAGAAGSAGAPPVPVCMPMTEQCNGKDDDCDGVIDEGCPAALSPSNAIQRKALGDSLGGADFAETCADSELLVGLRLGVGAWVDQVTAVCQKYSLHENTQSLPFQYTVMLTARRDLSPHPATTTSEVVDLICRDGTVMVGLHISQQHTAFAQDNDQIVVPEVTVDCGTPVLRMTSVAPHVEWQNLEQLGPVSGSFAGPDAWYESDRLDSTQVLVGFHGAAGAWVDRVGLTASALSVALQPE